MCKDNRLGRFTDQWACHGQIRDHPQGDGFHRSHGRRHGQHREPRHRAVYEQGNKEPHHQYAAQLPLCLITNQQRMISLLSFLYWNLSGCAQVGV